MPAEVLTTSVFICPVCESKKNSIFFSDFYHFEKNAYHLAKCSGCQLIFVQPMPDDGIIARMYGDQYFQGDFISGRFEGSYEEIFKKRRPEMEEILRRVESHVNVEKRILFEVGAAGGMFLKCAKDRGWKVSGLEFSSWGTKHANETYGIPVLQGNFLLATLPESSYPVIFFGDVFEHFTDPLFAIRKINRSLDLNGFVVMLLPMYISSWTFRFFMSLRGILKNVNLPKSFKTLLKFETDQNFNPPYHVFEYSKSTIRALLERNGFKMLEVKGNLPIPESLSAGKPGEKMSEKIFRLAALFLYHLIKFSSENFNFPLVRSLVIAQKISDL